jgi:hypothetical protein
LIYALIEEREEGFSINDLKQINSAVERIANDLDTIEKVC